MFTPKSEDTGEIEKGEGRNGNMEEKAGARSEAIRNEQCRMMTGEGRPEAEGGRAALESAQCGVAMEEAEAGIRVAFPASVGCRTGAGVS